MEDRTRRILETAISLAERDGYEAVRLRDVASQAEVALGTVYRRFKSKEDILVAALELEVERMGAYIQTRPIAGDDPVTRLGSAFVVMTGALVQKPNLARALLRAVASGVPEVAQKVAQFHATTTKFFTAFLFDHDAPDEEKERIAGFLQDIWFAKLVGWSGGLQTEASVGEDMTEATRRLLGA
jgi:AcrR family transcriptional regulator